MLHTATTLHTRCWRPHTQTCTCKFRIAHTHSLHAHYTHTHSNTLIQRNSGCKQMNRRPFSCTDLHMRNHLMHTCMSLNTHTHYSVLFSMPGRHVHISCSFSFVIRASAHESPLSLSSSPRSLPFYSLSLPRLPRSLSIWNGNEERFCGCLHPSPPRAGAPQLCQLKAQIKVQSVIYSPHMNHFWFSLLNPCMIPAKRKTRLHFQSLSQTNIYDGNP